METRECAETPLAEERLGNSAMDSTLLVTALELVALEKLIAVRKLMICERHCGHLTLVNEFEILYLYKCGLFDECMELCRRSMNELLEACCSTIQAYNVSFPEMLSLLDGELVSVFGIIGLLRHDMNLQFTGVFEFPSYFRINMMTLLLYLLVRCQKTLRTDSPHDAMVLLRYVHDRVFTADNDKYFLDRLILRLIYRSLRLGLHENTI